jgi:hypothetical protein
MEFKHGETYYYIDLLTDNILTDRWSDHDIDKARHNDFNTFKTKEEAASALKSVLDNLRQIRDDYDKNHIPSYVGRYFKSRFDSGKIILQDENNIVWEELITKETHTRSLDSFKSMMEGNDFRWCKFIPWTFKTSPTIFRVKRVSDDTIDILSLDIYVKRGERVVGLYSDTRDVDITFEEALEQYVTLSGHPCGELVDDDYDQSEQEQFKTAKSGS